MSSLIITTAVIGIVGQEAISEVSKSIFQSVAGIFYHSNPKVKELLQELDTYNELELIKTLIMEINSQTLNDNNLNIDIESLLICDKYNIIDNIDTATNDTITHNIETNDTETNNLDTPKHILPSICAAGQPFISETLAKCLYQLKDIVENIYREINELNEGVEYHKTLWFQSFRTPRYEAHLKNIGALQKIMNLKFKRLISLMNMHLRMDYKLFIQETRELKTSKPKPYFNTSLSSSVYAGIGEYEKKQLTKPTKPTNIRNSQIPRKICTPFNI